MKQLNRRAFGKLSTFLASAGALSLSANGTISGAVTRGAENRAFPKSFVWGSATSAYQIEGAVTEDGRGVCIWDTYSRIPGKIYGGDTADVADDSYHRYREDIALMKTIGLRACRFSIAWPRIFPDGAGQANPKGIDHYRRVTEALLQAGIEPFCTLYHWDLPQTLQDKGGWRSKATGQRFADYAGYTTGRLSDLINNWITINEMSSIVESGYGRGRDAPGLKLDNKALAQVRHNVVLAHGLGVQAIRASCKRPVKVGSAENAKEITPVFDAEEHVEAARKAMVEENAPYLTVMHTGKYTKGYLKKLGPDAPLFTTEELEIISTPTDFQGLNLYAATQVRAADTADGYAIVPKPASFPVMKSTWLYVAPETLYWVPKLAVETLGIREVFITENGCSAKDTVAANGEIYDTDRVMFLNAYLTQLQRGVSEGVPVKGYFVWSLLDNFEWVDGYSTRFGICYVDYATQKRTPKLSAKFLANVIARNAL